jgi:predicted TIM-barrel fold metal-dependent hydrolase
MDIVDAHPHVIAADRERYPFAPLGGTVSDWVLRGNPCEDYIAALDAAGIGRAVLVQASMGYGYDNSYTADSAAAHPERFVGVGAIDISAPETPERMAYWARERGLVGFRVFLTAPALGPDADAVLDDPKTFPVWEQARRLGTPMKLQIRHTAFRRVRALLERFSDVDVIIDHFASTPVEDGPPYLAARELFDLARFPRLHLLLSDHVIHATTKGKATTRSFLERVVGSFGSNRILWGSNYPSSAGTVSELLAIAQDALAFLTPMDRAAIFGRTALRLYPRLQTAKLR